MINTRKLLAEIQEIYPQVMGVGGDGVVQYEAGYTPDPPEMTAINELIAGHNPLEYGLQPEQQIILANGVHTARVTSSVRYLDPLPVTDTLFINGAPQTIDLVNGEGVVELTSNTPGTVFRLEYHGLFAIVKAE